MKKIAAYGSAIVGIFDAHGVTSYEAVEILYKVADEVVEERKTDHVSGKVFNILRDLPADDAAKILGDITGLIEKEAADKPIWKPWKALPYTGKGLKDIFEGAGKTQIRPGIEEGGITLKGPSDLGGGLKQQWEGAKETAMGLESLAPLPKSWHRRIEEEMGKSEAPSKPLDKPMPRSVDEFKKSYPDLHKGLVSRKPETVVMGPQKKAPVTGPQKKAPVTKTPTAPTAPTTPTTPARVEKPVAIHTPKDLGPMQAYRGLPQTNVMAPPVAKAPGTDIFMGGPQSAIIGAKQDSPKVAASGLPQDFIPEPMNTRPEVTTKPPKPIPPKLVPPKAEIIGPQKRVVSPQPTIEVDYKKDVDTDDETGEEDAGGYSVQVAGAPSTDVYKGNK